MGHSKATSHRLAEAAFAATLIDPMVAGMVHRLLLRLGVGPDWLSLSAALAMVWLALFLAYLRFGPVRREPAS